METIDPTQNSAEKLNIQLDEVNFENTEIAFSSRSDESLKQAHFLFNLLKSNFLMKIGKYATTVALKLRLPINGLIKKTIFQQFCGGETIAECAKTTKILDDYNIGTILDYSVEGKDSENDFEITTDEILRTLDTAHNNPHIPFSVFKISGLCKNKILEKAGSGSENLNPSELESYQKLENRIDRICRKASETNTPIFIDAEESWIQDAIDFLAMKMIRKFNGSKAVVYNTLQMYRHDRLAHMKSRIEDAKSEGFVYAVKIVRGAYMEKERLRAEEMGYPSPIQPDKKSTDNAYNEATLLALDNLNYCSFCSGTHNEKSSLLLASELDKRAVKRDDIKVYFAQLFGMSDHISFNLSSAGYNVAKYVPYGPVKEVMPYLIRRAEENTSVAGQTGRELTLINRELQRRKGKS